jgi:Aldo/keto reductase family
MTLLAMAFVVPHPGVTSAIIGPRTMEHLDDLLASADVSLSDDILDRIDEIVPPGCRPGSPLVAGRQRRATSAWTDRPEAVIPSLNSAQ